MESVTRAFYSRSDLDLVLTSPASARKVFAVRMGRIAAASVAIAVLLAAPFINVLAVLGGSRWLSAFGVVAAMGAVATAAALSLTVALFRVIGAKRTRLIAQIVAAVIGAAFVILLQIAAIFSAGSLSRFAALQSEWMLSHAPDTSSAFWWPARAVLGDYAALAGVMASGIAALGATIWLFSRRFGEHAVAAAGVSSAVVRQRRWSRGFRRRSASRALRHKEWTLLQRDPWLVSQTLMQILYLIPPALLLWVTFHDRNDSFVVLIPVVVMAAGQLAGGLAWLSISGEDAPDLVATAPITPQRILLAKIEAVIGMIALVFAPIVAVLTLDTVFAGIVYRIRRHCLRFRHIDRGSGRDGHPALLSRAGAAQPIPSQADLIPPRHIRRGVLLDCLGRDNRAGSRANLGRARDSGNRPRHPGRRLVDQSVADLTSQAKAARKRPRPTRIPIKIILRILAPIPAAKAGA
jgi:ABC-2 type transport system permease protein